jgi:biopolymer transport protein ExbD
MARKCPEIPSASLADIAFMLLIFFLVTTTMDIDSGLERRLPPWADQTEDIDRQINERNIFIVLVNKNNDLLVENEYTDIRLLREKTKEFLANPHNDSNLPEKELVYVPYFGEIMVAKNAVISLRNDLDTQYKTYIAVQNELVAAINELRDELAKQHFGQPYDKLQEDQQEAIRIIYPSRISEAEPQKR